MTLKIALNNLKIAMCRYNDNTRASYTEQINIKDSPWYIYLTTGNTNLIEKNFEEIRKHKDHPNDYSYPIGDFNKIVDSILKNGYKKELCNNTKFQNNFNGENWKGGKGPVKIGNDGFVWDGHHRCVALLYLLGPDYEITIKNNYLENIENISSITS